MLTINELLLTATKELLNLTPTPNLDAELILCYVLDLDRVGLILKKYDNVSQEQADIYKKLIKERIDGKPVQYIVGVQEFMGLEFEVSEDVLIPRPDTEILIETILKEVEGRKNLKILDIGTGSGAIPVSLARFIKDALLWSIDISEKASKMAWRNTVNNKVDNRVTLLLGDLFEPLNDIENKIKFDLIVSNPPYIPSDDIAELQIEVAKFEPRLALDGGVDGLDFYKRIINDALNHLVEDGIIAFEIGYDQAESVKALLTNKGFANVEIIKDLAGKDRVVIGRL